MAGLRVSKASPYRTICEVHREMYDELVERDDSQHLIELLEEAFGLGKMIFWRLLELEVGEPVKQFRRSPRFREYLAKDYSANQNYAVSLKRRQNR